VPAPEEDGAATTSKPEGDEDSDLEALMEEQSDVESVTSSDDEQAASESAPKSRRRGRRPEEGILGTLAVLVIALWTLRIPVMYMDISKCVAALPQGACVALNSLQAHYGIPACLPGEYPCVARRDGGASDEARPPRSIAGSKMNG